MQKNWIGRTFAILSIFIFVLIAGCESFAGKEQEPTIQPILAPVVSDITVVAEGVVVPVNNAELSFAENGIVEEVLVAKGGRVKSGEVIARIRGLEKMLVDILAAQTDVITAQQDLDEIFENLEVDRADALMDKLKAERNLETSINQKVNKQQGRGTRSDLERAQGNYGVAQAKLEDAQRRYYLAADKPPSDPGRAALLDQITSAIQEREQALAELNYYLLGPDPLEIGKSDADIAYYTAELEKAEETWKELQDGPAPDDVNLAEAKLSSAKLKFESLQKDLKDIEMVAPFDGTLVVNNLKKGEMVKSGTVLVKMADLSKWRVETTDLTELDIVGVRAGNNVKVTFDALPELEIPGVVSEVKQIGTNQQGDITYTVKVDLLQQSDRLLWNMTATVIFE